MHAYIMYMCVWHCMEVSHCYNGYFVKFILFVVSYYLYCNIIVPFKSAVFSLIVTVCFL